ncbi:MAG TPA: acyltransferase family protein, partial [Micromonosporaceae bacterium]
TESVNSAGRHGADADADAPAPHNERGFRPDVQGVRALAVLLVVVYHLYPTKLTGGYIGVDVFFVISGYLITGHLMTGLVRTGRIKLLEFWGRRARRLLPAAALVLLVTWIASRWILPATQLPATAHQIRASALYFQNWVLARDATNYLTAEDAPTPVQHFWSLSVEEQFYLVWPFLFLVAAGVALIWRRRGGRTTMFVLAAGVFGASLAYSAHETKVDPAAAYFVTTTRMWELAAGGLLALLSGPAERFLARQGWLAWAGLGLIIYAAVTLTGESAFPGTVALLPIVGAVLMLGCGSARARWGPAWLTSLRPAVFLGDISYSLYLWHWPLIVLWMDYSGGTIHYLDGPGIFAASILLAWLSKRFVEDPVRLAPSIAKYPSRSLATALTVLVPVVVVAFYSAPGPYHVKLNSKHPGAAVLAGDVHNVPAAPMQPPAVDAKLDKEDDLPCQTTQLASKPRVCITGDTTHPKLRVALVGDSAIGQWRKDIELTAKQRHWEVIVQMHGECTWTTTTLLMLDSDETYPTCRKWGALVLHDLLTKYRPDVVITSTRAMLTTPSHPTRGPAAFAEIADGIVPYWRKLIQAGIGVVAIRDTPEMGRDIPDCLSTPGAKPDDCTEAAKKAIAPGTPLVRAVAKMHGQVDLIDMDDLICGTRCHPVVGNVEVYRDQHHLTLTYSLTMRPYLQQRLLETPTMRALDA